MASLATHFTASIFLCPLGIRRLISSISLYLKNPSLYTSKIWYFSKPNWKNLDLYTLLITLPIASFSHIFIFFAISGHPTYEFSFLQQSLVVFFFWALLILIVLRESFDLYTVPNSFVFVFAGTAFVIEFYMNGKGVIGLGGVGYRILGGLAVLCGACCVYLSVRPSAFFVDFLLSCGLVLKGTWVLQVGLSLYTDAFGFKGCRKISWTTLVGEEADLKCELEDDRWRGIALMNFLFVVHVVMVIVGSFVLFGLLSRCRRLRCGEGSGGSLADMGGSEGIVMRPLPELEMD